ncbi:MAG: WD40 repeat domain-containing protein, partial [Bryobacterales bacterium]|nr:WD40 repeat domain-containing protein [Bryobacterales bacterium]
IWDVVFSADGSTLATAAGDGTVVIWRQDGKAWKEYWRLPPQDDMVRVAAFAPENDVIAAGNQNGSLALWNVAQKRLLAELISKGPAIRALAYSPDGRLLLSGNADGIVHVWDTAKHVQESSFKVCVGAVNDLVFSADGELLASCGAGENTITLWDANSRKVRRVLTGHTGPVSAVAFSPDRTKIASASKDTTVNVWNLTSGQLLKSLVHPQAISTVAFSPDGERLAAGGAFHTVQVWDAHSYKLLNDFHAHWSDICKVRFLPHGDTLVTAGEDNLTRIWSVADLPEAPDARHNEPSPLATFNVHKDWSMWSSFSSDSSQLVAAVGMVPFGLGLWSLKDPSRGVSLNLRQNDGDHMFQQSMGFLPGEPTLVTCLSRKGKPQIAIWDPQKHVMRDSFEPGSFVPKEGEMSYATSALSPSGTTLALLSQSDESMTLIDVVTREARWCKRSESGKPSTPAFSPDGKILAVGTKNGMVLLIDASTGEEIREPLTHGTVAVDAIAFSPNGTLASTDKQGIVKLWKSPAFTCEQLPTIHREWIRSAVFSPDGNLLATAAGAGFLEPNPGPERGEVCVWDVKLRRILAKFHSHYGCVTSAVFSPDGKRLATTGRDGKMHLWDVEEVLQKAAVKDTEPEKGEVTSATVSVGKDQ